MGRIRMDGMTNDSRPENEETEKRRTERSAEPEMRVISEVILSIWSICPMVLLLFFSARARVDQPTLGPKQVPDPTSSTSHPPTLRAPLD